MKKQLLLLVMILLPMVASGYDFEVNGIYYDIISSTDLTVSIAGGENEYSDDLIIPNEVFFSGRTLKVIGISAGAFSSSKNLTQIKIPDFIISIGSHAFLGCSSLKKVEIEDSETPLAIKANDTFSGIFRLCPLEELYIGRDISVDESQWISPFGLGELKSRRLSIVLGDKVSMLCNNIFSSAKKLYTIIIPENVKYIGESAFEGTSLSTIVIPNGVSEIRKRTFMSCSNLRSVVLSSNTTIIDEYAFYSCSNLTSIELPDVLKQIGKATFGGCKSLSEIILPNDIKQIGEYAFDECNSLTKVISKAPNPPSINDNSFSTTTYWNANLTVPYGTSENYSMANGWKNFDNINEDHSTIPSFRLYYYVNNIEYKSYDLEYGAKITPEPAPTKEGYTFSGWSEIPETMPAHDVIVTGTFEKIPGYTENIKMTVPNGDRTAIGYSSSFGLDFTGIEDVKAWIVTGFTDDANVLLSRVRIVPPYTGLYLTSNVAGVEVDVPTTDKDIYYANLLKAAVEEETIQPTETHDGVEFTNFVVGKLTSGEMGFVRVKTARTLGPNKSRLLVPSSYYPVANAAHEFNVEFLDDDATTDIKGKEAVRQTANQLYDLQGRMVSVSQARKGIYIYKGKKYVIK